MPKLQNRENQSFPTDSNIMVSPVASGTGRRLLSTNGSNLVHCCSLPRFDVGLSRELSPLRGKAKPFFVIGAECFIGHSATNVGLLAIMGR